VAIVRSWTVAVSEVTRVADELEELRLQVAALQKGLQVTRDQMKSLKAEVAALKGTSTSSPLSGVSVGSSEGILTVSPDTGSTLKGVLVPPSKDQKSIEYIVELQIDHRAAPLAQAEAALKKLRGHPDDKEAADALEQAVRRLKEQSKSKPETAKPQKY
jgi:hypothetical protein